MKNGLLIWNVILTLVAGYLLISHFGSGKKGNGTGKLANTKDSVTTNFKLAYFEMDSVANNFELVKDVKAELSRKETAITSEIERRARALQDRYTYFQNKEESGSLSQAERDSAAVELKKMDDDIKMRKQELDQEYFELKTRKENEVKKSIESFIKDYNKDKKFSYIMSYEPGIFFYKDTTMNITADVIKGLNQAFPPAKKANK